MPTTAGSWTSNYETNYEHLEADDAEKDVFMPSEEARTSIFNYLATHGQLLVSNRYILKEFEELTSSALEKATQDHILLGILQDHGWNGTQYRPSRGGVSINVDSFTAALSNLFLKKQRSVIGLGSVSEDPHPPSIGSADQGDQMSSVSSLVSVSETTDIVERQIKSFCSNLLIGYLKDEGDVAVGSEKFLGSVMLVDISGFSKFSSSMCSKGVTGLDGLHKATNDFLGHFIDIVYKYRGDVVSFAGDALICVFREDSTVKAPMSSDFCLRALQCACELRQRRTEELGTHIAVSTGDLTLGILGGLNDEWTYLLNGPCIAKLASCIDEAGPAEVVACEACFDAARAAAAAAAPAAAVVNAEVTDSIVSAELCQKGGSYRILSVSSAAAEAWTPRFEHPDAQVEDYVVELAEIFVPFPVLNSIRSRSLDSIAELRQVTTMFLKLDSYSPEKHQDPLSLQPFFLVLQEVLATSGGFLRQFLVDDKGCVAIAMWGVPCFANANDCARGLYCSVTMSQRAKTVDHACSIGLTTGNVYCGHVGSVARRDFVGIGDKVNLASRLMGKAGGRVLVDQATYDQLPRESKAKLAMLEEALVLKGQSAPIRPFYYASEEVPVLTNVESDVMHRFDDDGIVLRDDVVESLAAQLEKTCDLNDESAELRNKRRRSSVLRTLKPTLSRANSNVSNSKGRIATMKKGSAAISSDISMSFRRLLTEDDPDDDLVEVSRSIGSAGVLGSQSDSTFAPAAGEVGKSSDDDVLNYWTEPSLEKPPPPQVATSEHPGIERAAGLNFSVVIGPPGSGKSTIAQFFKIAAMNHKVQNIVHVQALPGDEFIKCEVLARIFWALANPLNKIENIDQLSVQIETVKLLVYKAHPELNHDRPQLRAAQQHMLYLLGLITADELTVTPPLQPSASPSFKASGLLSSSHTVTEAAQSLFSMMSSKMSTKTSLTAKIAIDTIDEVNQSSKVAGHIGSTVRALSGFFQQRSGSTTPISAGLSRSSKQKEIMVNLNSPGRQSEKHVSRKIDGHSTRHRSSSRSQGDMPSHRYRSPRISLRRSVSKRRSEANSSTLMINDEMHIEDERLQTVCYNVFKFLLSKTRTVIIVDDAQHCDEFTLGELSGWLNMKTVHCSVLLTVLSNPDMAAQRRASAGLSGSATGVRSESNFADLMTSYGIRIGIKSVPIMADPATVIMQLDDLKREEVRNLLVRTLGEQAVSDTLVDRVMAISHGNAFWCKTIADFISEFGSNDIMRVEAVESGRSSGGEGDGESEGNAKLKRLLNFLAISRLEKLSPEEQLIVKHASVIGQEVREAVLMAVIPRQLLLDGDTLSRALDSLVVRGILYCVKEKPELIFKFRNDLLRSKIYELLPLGDSSKIHLAVAKFIENHYQADLRSHYASLAVHYRMAPQTRKLAFNYSLLAASEAVHSGSFQSAIDICIDTQSLIHDDSERKLLYKTVEEGCMSAAAALESPRAAMSAERRMIRGKSATDASPNTYFGAALTAAAKTTNVFYERFDALRREIGLDIIRSGPSSVASSVKASPFLQPLLYDRLSTDVDEAVNDVFSSPPDELDVPLVSSRLSRKPPATVIAARRPECCLIA